MGVIMRKEANGIFCLYSQSILGLHKYWPNSSCQKSLYCKKKSFLIWKVKASTIIIASPLGSAGQIENEVEYTPTKSFSNHCRDPFVSKGGPIRHAELLHFGLHIAMKSGRTQQQNWVMHRWNQMNTLFKCAHSKMNFQTPIFFLVFSGCLFDYLYL